VIFVARHEQLYLNRLWEAIEITAERGSKYKVRWAGVDSRSGKPWDQSWVAKRDCTENLVREWKIKQRCPFLSQKKTHGVIKWSDFIYT
jgi:hypothetical protein